MRLHVRCGACGIHQQIRTNDIQDAKHISFYCMACWKPTRSEVLGIETEPDPNALWYDRNADQLYADTAEEEAYNYYRECVQKNEDTIG